MTRRKYVRYPTVSSGLNGEYHDLSNDPAELTNLYTDPAWQSQVQWLEQAFEAVFTWPN